MKGRVSSPENTPGRHSLTPSRKEIREVTVERSSFKYCYCQKEQPTRKRAIELEKGQQTLKVW